MGKCERFWETVQNEFWTRVRPQDLEETKIRLKYFIDHYNHHRPHQGLDGQVPADRFFGVAQEVRSVIEKTVEQNALNMALGELPKAPAFLIGQVGDQRIAFHGTSGQFFLTHENLSGESNGESIRDESKSESDTKPSIPGDSAAGEGSEDKEVLKNSELKLESQVPGDTGEGIVGESERRGPGEGKGESQNNNAVLDGEINEAGSTSSASDKADQILADDQSSDSGNDGGIINSAPSPEGRICG